MERKIGPLYATPEEAIASHRRNLQQYVEMLGMIEQDLKHIADNWSDEPENWLEQARALVKLAIPRLEGEIKDLR